MPWGFVICHGPLNLTTVGTHLGGGVNGRKAHGTSGNWEPVL